MVDYLSARLLNGAGMHGAIVLMYHSIGEGDSEWSLPLNIFVSHIELIRDCGWNTLTIGDLVSGADVSGPSVILTFDDGYKNNLKAVDELLQRNMKASIYPVAGQLGQKVDWISDRGGSLELLSGDDLEAIHTQGIEIGSHGMTHRPLDSLSPAEVEREMIESKRDLEENIQDRVSSFAYPYGRFNDQIARIVQRSGYSSACTTRSGSVNGEFDSFTIRRLTIYRGDTDSVLARKLALAGNDASWRRVVRYYASQAANRFGFNNRV